jgi:hypothetical protein
MSQKTHKQVRKLKRLSSAFSDIVESDDYTEFCIINKKDKYDPTTFYNYFNFYYGK